MSPQSLFSRLNSRTVWRAALFGSTLAGAVLLLGLLLDPPSAFTPSLFAVLAALAAGSLAALAGLIFFAKLEAAVTRLSAARWFTPAALALPGLALLTAWLGLLWPAGRTPGLDPYLLRLQPLLLWLALSAFAILAALLLTTRGTGLSPDRSFWLAWGVCLGLAALLWLLAALTGLGIRDSSGYWNKAAVPLTGLQLLGLLLMGQLVEGSAALRRSRSRWLDGVLFVLIWGLAAWAWTLQPAPSSTFSSDAWLPNLAYYPTSDAASFDLMGQSILIGEGIRASIDKPLYLAFRSLFNLSCGSAYPCVNTVQAAFLALIPAVLYLLGRKFNSRAFGLTLAGAAVFKELNGQTLTNLLQLTNAQEAMTELPVLLLLVIFALLLTGWLRDPARLDWRLLAAGGALGLAGLIRLNAFTILPFALLLVALAAGRARGRWWKAPALFGLVFLLAWLPWMIRCQVVDGNAFAFIRNKTSGVIVADRYNPILQDETPTAAVSPTLSTLTPQPSPLVSQPEEKPSGRDYGELIYSITNHYTHALIASAFVIPPDPRLYPTKDYHRLPYWQLDWNGSLGGLDALTLGLNLLLLTGGLALAWRRLGWAGLVPLAVLLGYTAASAASLTSGGRYIQPADWVIYFYHLFALWHLLSWLLARLGLRKIETAAPSTETPATPRRAPLAAAVLAVLLLGLLPAGLELAFPQRYPLPEEARLQAVLAENTDLSAFLASNPQAFAASGRLLSPRFYPAQQADNMVETDTPFSAKPFPNLVFWLLNSQRTAVVLPLAAPPASLPNASDVLVVGCHEKDRVNALAVWILRPAASPDDERQIEPLALPPAGPLACPPRQPAP